jgi:hypothetical protein
MVQMIGRGLRVVDPELHPGIVKTDCIVLDFGISALKHGTIEQEIDLHERVKRRGVAPTKTCPECSAVVPASTLHCPFCGYVWGPETTLIDDFAMSEIDLLERSPFRWVEIADDGSAAFACGFQAWAGIMYYAGRWYAVGGGRDRPARLVATGERTVCLAAADNWLSEHETDKAAHKSRQWLDQPPTEKQLEWLEPQYRTAPELTRYRASALMTFQFHRDAIERTVLGAAEQVAA